MTTTETATCVAWSHTAGFAGMTCDRPAKGTFEAGMYKGKPACLQHLAGERRSLANEAKNRDLRAKQDDARKRADAIVAQLGFGHADYSTFSHGVVGIALTFEEAEALVARLNA